MKQAFHVFQAGYRNIMYVRPVGSTQDFLIQILLSVSYAVEDFLRSQGKTAIPKLITLTTYKPHRHDAVIKVVEHDWETGVWCEFNGERIEFCYSKFNHYFPNVREGDKIYVQFKLQGE